MRPPPYASDYADLATVAADILAQRERLYPAMVEDGRLPAAQAASGIRIARAVARQLRDLVDGAEPYECELDWIATNGQRGAGWFEIRADLAGAVKRSAARAADSDDRRIYAARVAAIAWNWEPNGPGMQLPRIVALAAAIWETRRPQSIERIAA